jgi:DNA-binding CsgD family transcriptional regulator
MDSLHRLVCDIYDGPLDLSHFSRIASAIQTELEASASSLLVTTTAVAAPLGVIHKTENFDPGATRDYTAHYGARNVWLRAHNPRGGFVTRGSDLVDERTFGKSAFGAEWCPRVDIRHLLGTQLSLRVGLNVQHALYRGRNEADFTRRDMERFAILSRHVGRAMQIADRLETLAGQRQLCLDLLGKLGVGVMILDRDLRGVMLNAVAEAMVRDRRWFQMSQQAVQPAFVRQARAFSAAVARAIEAGAGRGVDLPALLRLRGEGGVLPVMIAPARIGGFAPGAGETAIVLCADPDARVRPDPDVVARAFDLTSREGAVVAALLAGDTLAEHAARSGVSLSTVKSQLQAAFAKTGFSRQAALVAAAAAHPAVRLGARRG